MMTSSFSILKNILSPTSTHEPPGSLFSTEDFHESISCIRLLAPMQRDEWLTKSRNLVRNLALEKQGCTLTLIGDGIRDLNQHDLENFNKAIATSQGSRILLDINAHGGMIDNLHTIQLGNDFLIPVKSLLKSALENVRNKRVDIISEACDSGQFCKDSAYLPTNAHYIGMSDHGVYPYYTNQLNKKLIIQPISLTAENLLVFSLTNDPYMSIGKGEPPHLCTQRSSYDLDELLKLRSGIRFSKAEKLNISTKLSSHGVKPEQISIAIKKLEDNKIDKNLRLSDTELYSTALAVVHLAQQYHEKSNPVMSESIMHNPVQSNKDHGKNRHVLALEIYQDLMHIRDHALYEPYTKEVPKLLRVPVMSFITAMSKNHDPEHPVRAVRNSLIDMGMENLTLTSMGLSIGETPAAIAMMASHLAESGLEHFASWDEIDKMPRFTQQERLTWSRMIEVRATAELLAWPSKATQILSHSIKSWMDDTLSKKNPEKDITEPSLKFKPSLQSSSFPADRNLLFGHDKSDFSFMKTKKDEVNLFPSKPLLSPGAYRETKGLLGVTSPKHAWDVISKQMSAMPQLSPLKSESQISYLSYHSKFNGLLENNKSKTAWDKIRLQNGDAKLSTPDFKGLASGHESKTAWDIIKLKSDYILPHSSFNKNSPTLFAESLTRTQGLAYQPSTNLKIRKKSV